MKKDKIIRKIEDSSDDQIILDKMGITDEEALEIAAAIVAKRPNAQEIYLSNNKIGDQGAIELAKKFAELSELLFIDLQFNKIAKEGITALFELKSQKADLDMSLCGNALAPDEILKLEIAAIKKTV